MKHSMKKMYGGTMKKKKMYGGSKKKMMKGGSNAKMPKSVYKKGSELGMKSVNAGRDSNTDITRADIIIAAKENKKMYGGMANPNKDEMMMYGGSMYKKMMKYAGGPVMNERGMKVPGMMKDGGGLKKMPGGGFMRSMDLPKAQVGKMLTKGFEKVGSKIKNLFKKKKNTNLDTTIDGKDVANNAFLGTNRQGQSVYKFGTKGGDHKLDPSQVEKARKFFLGTKMYGGSKKKMK